MNRGPETIVQSLPQADDGTAPGGPTSGHDDEMTRRWEGGIEAPQEGGSHAPAAGTVATTLSPGTGETLPGASHVRGSGRMAGRYQILERLGRGGMATVYRAHDPTIGRDVAIKFLHASLCEDAGYRARFLREARAAGGLQHPNIVVVHDVGEIDGRPYMAMELLEGDTLSAVMESQAGGLPLRDVTVMGIQLARALDYAHQRRIVHRDIKPGNICRLRGSQTVKVMDFGIAHMESGTSEMRTRVGDVLGTPQYMSPEQTRGERLDGRSDLFSVGIVMYQALTGQRPFQADSLVALAVKIAKDDPPPLEKLRPDVPASLRRVVERCLAKAPDRRFQTGADLSEALSRVLTEIDETALARSRNPRVSLRVKWAGTMALIVAVVMAFTASLITSRQHAAMLRQVTETGASLARFIAAQNASAALYGDWEWDKSQALLQRMMETRDFHSITLVDQGGIVRASSITSLIGQPYKAPVAEPVGASAGGVAITRFMDSGESVLGFSAPITFQTKRVGAVALGLPERPLTQVAQLANVLMLVLVVVTVLAVAIAMYFVANWFARPIRELSDAMREIGKGRFDHRIAQQRNDEFGLLYTAFDQMAQQLADRQSGASPPTQAPAAAASEPDTDSTEGLSQPSDEPTQPRTLVAARSGARTDAPGDVR
jgi:eukaryotic-like serine/threonine-protein kinase